MVWGIIPSRFSNVKRVFLHHLGLIYCWVFIPTVPHMSSLPHAAAPCEMILSFLAPKWGSKISLLEMGWYIFGIYFSLMVWVGATELWSMLLLSDTIEKKKVNGCIWMVTSIGGTVLHLHDYGKKSSSSWHFLTWWNYHNLKFRVSGSCSVLFHCKQTYLGLNFSLELVFSLLCIYIYILYALLSKTRNI